MWNLIISNPSESAVVILVIVLCLWLIFQDDEPAYEDDGIPTPKQEPDPYDPRSDYYAGADVASNDDECNVVLHDFNGRHDER